MTKERKTTANMCYKKLTISELFGRSFTASTFLTGRQDIARIDMAAFHSTARSQSYKVEIEYETTGGNKSDYPKFETMLD